MLLILAGGLWSGAVAGRLGYLAILRHRQYDEMAARQQQRAIEITPERGTIYDRNGRELAVSLPVESCFAVPPEIGDPGLAAHLLAPILDIPVKDLVKRLRTDHRFVWVQRRLAPEVVQRIQALNLRGIYFEREMERFYPKGQLAAQVLGFVDIDGHGQAGIEYSLDKEISGKPGEIFVLADGHRRYYQRREQPPVPGANVELTIDENIQYIAEKELAQAIQDTDSAAGSILVMNPSTGALLAMANWPTFNPNLPSNSSPQSRQNRAISDIYEPGSTFKTITLSAALDAGAVTSDEVFNCQMGHILLAGRLIHDWHPFGLLTVGEVLMHSSDVGAIKIALKEGDANFYHYMRAYGFGQKTGIRLPWESPGLLRSPKLWRPSTIGSLAMGQAVGVTTLQLIRAVSAIANGGLLYQPRIVSSITVDGKQFTPPDEPPTRAIRATTAATMRHMMEGVVLGGTGHKAQLDGYTTAGKTGTAQKIDPETHRYSRRNFMASFIGYAPINNPAVVTLVVLDSPHKGNHEGGWAAAPVFKRVMQQVMNYLGVPRDLPVQATTETAALRTHARPQRNVPQRVAARTIPARLTETSTVATETLPAGILPMPSLLGKTARQANEQCLRLGLRPRFEGDGIAVGQEPAAGTPVPAGTRVVVRFALRPAPVSADGRSGDAP
ncbi:MAG: transpeptidase family protein [Acidobacteriota bacterium]|nr:transpeptidase family protein [Acidobacteriota bacterium]